MVRCALERYIARALCDCQLVLLFSDSNVVRLPLTNEGKGHRENIKRSMEIFLRNTNLPGSQTPSGHIAESFHPECQRECPGCPAETVVGTREKGEYVYIGRELLLWVFFIVSILPRLSSINIWPETKSENSQVIAGNMIEDLLWQSPSHQSPSAWRGCRWSAQGGLATSAGPTYHLKGKTKRQRYREKYGRGR